MTLRAVVAVGAAIAVLAVILLWRAEPSRDAAPAESRHVPEAPATAVDASLVPAIKTAEAASAQAMRDATAADAVASAADAVAANAAKFAENGKLAAEKARKTAVAACKAPDAKLGCATSEDGSRYEGAQSCRTEGCGPDGYGVFTDTRRGWESQGKWENWSLVLGCDSMKGVITYCGQQVASAWSGFGVSYNTEAAAISAVWVKGVGQNPMQLDYPTGSRMRGNMTDYILDGPGIYERSDKRVLRGSWRAGKLLSGIVVYPVSGDVTSAAFVDGNADSGSIRYRDGRLFVGEIEDNPALPQARPRRGVLYAPDGGIAFQGLWRDGVPVPE